MQTEGTVSYLECSDRCSMGKGFGKSSTVYVRIIGLVKFYAGRALFRPIEVPGPYKERGEE